MPLNPDLAGDQQDIAYEPVSLGNKCETKFQIIRKLNDLLSEPMSELEFRLTLAPPNRGEVPFGWDVFDNQVTTFYAAREFLRREFVGVYEREDLYPGPAGSVLHRVFPGVNYLHDFCGEQLPDQNMTHEVIDSRYTEAKQRFEGRAKRFLQRMERPGHFLYMTLCEDFPDRNGARDMLELLGSRNGEHRPHLLLYGLRDKDSDLTELEAAGLVTKAYRAADHDKPKGREFEGNDAAWDRALATFQLKLPPELA